MNVSNTTQRLRGTPNGATGPGGRPIQDNRTGSNTSVTNNASGNSDRNAPGPQISRAEKFEDEKRRIIESCFVKKDADGAIFESYITHIRIEEDAAYPSSPPPRESPSDNKKPRVIIVAVRKSGRVRMHKARENGNGTFSIGKTWVLDDLTLIESFTNAIPTTSEEQQNKARAGPTGFIVTVQKPYYWNAATAKEKDFFIFSLIKIFKKYTGGRLPELHGFSSAELDQLGGAPRAVTPGIQSVAQPILPSSIPLGLGARVPSQEAARVREPSSAPSDSSRERRPRPPQERPSQERPPQERQLHSAVSHPLRTTTSNDRIHLPGSFPSTDSIHDPSPQNSQPQLRSKRSESPALRARGSHPDFPKAGAAQSTDSFRSGQESFVSGRSSNERSRSRQNGNYAGGGSNISVAQQRATASEERPSTASRNDPVSNPYVAVQDQAPAKQAPALNFDPDSSEKPLDQPIPIRPYDTSNGNSRDAPTTGGAPSRGGRGTPSLHQSESSADHLPDETRPTTASSHDVQANKTVFQGSTPSISAAKDDDLTTPKATTTAFSPTVPPETPTEEAHRPGLGPMIKKKSNNEVANKFRKAATAYNAFKPRAGGALEKAGDDKTVSGDGITGVFQAPSLLRSTTQDDSRPSTPKQSLEIRPSTPEPKKEVPLINITTSPAKPVIPANSEPDFQRPVESEKPPPIPVKAQDDRRKKRRSDHSAKYAKVIGINPSLIEGRTFEIESVLNDFGWGEENTERTTFEDLETGIRKELARVEAGSWLGAVDINDDRVMAVGEMMDRVIAECDELDCLLTLYNVELGTLSEDVAYIEAQSQGLQVQTANQKLLQTELKNLLDNISISATQLKALKDESLTKPEGIEKVEVALDDLYNAMLTIDPKLRHNDVRPLTTDQASLHRNGSTGHGGSELSSMHAVREKREGYRREITDFLQRLKQCMSVKFRETEAEILDALESSRNNKASATSTKLDEQLRVRPKKGLWQYSPLMLFAREMEPSEWEDLMRMYEVSAKRPYQDEFRDNVFAWKRITRKSNGDDQDVLFTNPEKEPEGIVGRKLTVKRTKTVRTDGSSRISSGDKPNDGKVTAQEAFSGALTEMTRTIFNEQNFVVDLFHASSLDVQDFGAAISLKPLQRQGGDLMAKKSFDPDRNMARKVLSIMEEMYSFWPIDMQNLVDWAVKQDALNAVGVLFALESRSLEYEETNQEFLVQTLAKAHDRLNAHFSRFIEEQNRGIEDTKVKIKKRKGVIAFMKTFPNFSITIENMLQPTNDDLPVRTIVNDAYQKLNQTMFESLKFIAKESPNAAQASACTGVDPEDKEALNYHILLIENMNHYIEEVATRNNPVLDEWNFRARAEMGEHMELYLAAVIRRPLGKLLDFLESTETLVRNNPGSPNSIATRASHSRSTFKKILSSHDAKEIRRGIETLKKRVEKHFGDGDDTPGLSRELIVKVCRECEARYLSVGERVNKVVTDVYDGSLEVEWRREDVVGAFRKY